mmetsp:Transcript_50764/g.110155  ORF Transcript_50764/g.110155 Transcript_50764/m.110155 type:complete len:246 (-) Transcript_50764:199-936(-)
MLDPLLCPLLLPHQVSNVDDKDWNALLQQELVRVDQLLVVDEFPMGPMFEALIHQGLLRVTGQCREAWRPPGENVNRLQFLDCGLDHFWRQRRGFQAPELFLDGVDPVRGLLEKNGPLKVPEFAVGLQNRAEVLPGRNVLIPALVLHDPAALALPVRPVGAECAQVRAAHQDSSERGAPMEWSRHFHEQEALARLNQVLALHALVAVEPADKGDGFRVLLGGVVIASSICEDTTLLAAPKGSGSP